MMTVQDIANQVGLTADAVRHYVRIGLLHPQRNPANGYRLFSKAEMYRLHFIVRAKQLGFTLAEIRQVFIDTEQDSSPCPRVRDILQRNIVKNRKKIDELSSLQQRMELAQQEWQSIPDKVPNEDSFCHLIERINV